MPAGEAGNLKNFKLYCPKGQGIIQRMYTQFLWAHYQIYFAC
jgi:hypothetical protein